MERLLVAKLDTRDCDAELWLNGIALARSDAARPSVLLPVHEYTVAGSNRLELVIWPRPAQEPPATAPPPLRLSADGRRAARARILLPRIGSVADEGTARTLAQLDWAPAEGTAYDAPLALQQEVTLPVNFPRWRWLDAPVVEQPELLREPACAFVQEPSAPGASILIGNIREARGLRFKAVAIVGLSEGLFPSVERPDPFLQESLREELGLDSRLEREQASLFYQAVTRADVHLLLTRPYLSDDGEAWEPSPYWNAVASLFEKDTSVQKIRPDDPRPLADAASSHELLFWAVRRRGLPQNYANLETRWKQLQHARDVIHARRTKRADGSNEGQIHDLQVDLANRFAPEKIWSASRLETYGTCPQMFYVKTVLDLEATAPPSLGLDIAQVGSILHKVLEEVYRTSDNPGDVNSVLKRLPEIAKSVFATAPQDFGFRPSELWELEQDQYLAMLETTIVALADTSEGWTPMAYEQAFGILDTPPLEI